MRIAVDAMGGDYAPAVVVEAVADALRMISSFRPFSKASFSISVTKPYL